MKILKHGNIQSHTFTCKRCGCEFIAFANEYTETQVRDPITCKIFWTFANVDCPECGQHNTKEVQND